MRARECAELAILVLALGLPACSTGEEGPASVAPEAAAEAGAEGGELEAGEGGPRGVCEVVGSTCRGNAEPCCESIFGFRVDLAGKCRAQDKTLFACQTSLCVLNDAEGCYQRALPDGGVEVFETPTIWPPNLLGPDLAECSEGVREQVYGLPFCP